MPSKKNAEGSVATDVPTDVPAPTKKPRAPKKKPSEPSDALDKTQPTKESVRKHRRAKPGQAAAREARQLSRSDDLLLRKRPVVQMIHQSLPSGKDYRIAAGAVEFYLNHLAHFLNKFLRCGKLAAGKAKRDTVRPEDLDFVLSLYGTYTDSPVDLPK